MAEWWKTCKKAVQNYNELLQNPKDRMRTERLLFESKEQRVEKLKVLEVIVDHIVKFEALSHNQRDL